MKLGSIFAVLFLVGLVEVPAVHAGGPRFVSGPGIWLQPGQVEVWGTAELQYYTDPGNLAASVTHAQADAMVAAAAAVWNVPTSSLALMQGGQLAEHVSAENTYFDGSQVVFPADVESSNEAAIPVAVIYDSDGSVTDLLLGTGASEPAGCRQNAVTESVDDIQMDGRIHHALVILNGRCVGSAPEQLTQMQYQLARAFGRVLGVAWSQTNDNVFTAVSTVTADEQAYWPVMHPLDVICGTYTYQCMSNPFTLRIDDLSALAELYPVTQGNIGPGKQLSNNDAVSVSGTINFPMGQGMSWVNIVAHRLHAGFTETWETVSGISGDGYQQALSNPVTQVQAASAGAPWGSSEGAFYLAAVPVNTLSNVYFTTEAINPLYTGAYALGPYVRPPVTPSGSAQTTVDWSALGGTYWGGMTAYDGASTCWPGNDGTEAAPASFDASGWNDGLLCGWGHSSWWGAVVRAGHSYTLEVTATDETGAASTSKAQPVVGMWSASDATGTLPTLGSQAVPFNSMSLGMTQLRMDAPASDTPLRFVISDQFGAGRPDFTYTARMLYADTVSPASVGVGGGTITITGMGFRRGNLVQVNGVTATVQSWTATQIVARAPAMAVSGAVVGAPVQVSVIDASTAGRTDIQNALTYSNAADLIEEVSAPLSLETGVASGVPFAVRVLASDGVTPMQGDLVSFAVTGGSAALGVSGGSSACTVVTDSNGIAQTTVTGGAPGAVTLSATEVSGGATVQVSVVDTAPVRAFTVVQAPVYVAAGSGGSWSVQVLATQDGVPVPNVGVTWSASAGLGLGSTAVMTGANGIATVVVSAANVAAGSSNTVTGCVWATVCATWTINGVDASQWQIAAASGAGQNVAQGVQLGSVGLLVTDLSGHVIEGAPVSVYQRVLGWEGTCPAEGRCPAAPVLTSSEQNEVSDPTGLITLTPIQLPGIPQTVQVAASTGTEGFVTVTLAVSP